MVEQDVSFTNGWRGNDRSPSLSPSPTKLSNLIPMVKDQDSEAPSIVHLSSFALLRQRTLETLYGTTSSSSTTTTTSSSTTTTADKSPKGSVDRDIQALVDLINHHPDYATLSSCAGRIAVFDSQSSQYQEIPSNRRPFLSPGRHDEEPLTSPILQSHDDDDDSVLYDSQLQQQLPRQQEQQQQSSRGFESGKGGSGQWLLVSHDEVLEADLWNALTSKSTSSSRNLISSTPVGQSSDVHRSEQGDRPHHIKDDNADSTAFRNNARLVTFKFEPVLLHVAAANLHRGQQLLQVALQCGMRESGLVVTKHRVTVCLRTTGRALAVPLFPTNVATTNTTTTTTGTAASDLNTAWLGIQRPYLSALLHEANRRMRENSVRRDQLYHCIQEVLFTPRSVMSANNASRSNSTIKTTTTATMIACNPWPDLNLWGHATLVIPVVRSTISGNTKSAADDHAQQLQGAQQQDRFELSDNDVDVLVMGGYGRGPELRQSMPHEQQHHDASIHDRVATMTIRRSSSLYCLQWRNRQASCWEAVAFVNETECPESTQSLDGPSNKRPSNITQSWLGVGVMHTTFTPREGLAACLIQQPEKISSTCSWIVSFGGRQGPSRPLADLILLQYDVGRGTAYMGIPTYVAGTAPSARWGHTLTALPTSDNYVDRKMAVLIGGRNHYGTSEDSIYILSLIGASSNSASNHLQWDQVITGPTSLSVVVSRYHHCATTVGDGLVFVFGGLTSTEDVLSCFDDPEDRDSCDVHGFTLSCNTTPPQLEEIIRIAQNGLLRFGHAASIVATNADIPRERSPSDTTGMVDRVSYMLVSGGLTMPVGAKRNRRLFKLFKLSASRQQSRSMEVIPLYMDEIHFADAGPLIHHSCLLLSSSMVTFESSSHDPHEITACVAVVGGGVAGFAFQPCFAKSWWMQFRISLANADINQSRTNESQLIASEMQERLKHSTTEGSQERPMAHAVSQVGSESITEHGQKAKVLYVLKPNAKALKIELEASQMLDKKYRMTKVDNGSLNSNAYFTNTDMAHRVKDREESLLASLVAVPVCRFCFEMIAGVYSKSRIPAENGSAIVLDNVPSWISWIVGYGEQPVPLSSSMLARNRNRKNRP